MRYSAILLALGLFAYVGAEGADTTKNGAPKKISITPEKRAELESIKKDFDGNPYAYVVRVQGSGMVRIKRKVGTVTSAALKTKVYPGDRILTDDKSTAEIMLSDGSIVRVGLNTDYKIEEVKKENGMFTWSFDMAKGSIRAIVEKSADKKTVKFRTTTPAGTMGVRGTQFVYSHDPMTKYTEIFTLEGLVFFGARDCEAKKNCVEVPKNKKSRILEGTERPELISDFQMQDLVKKARFANSGKTEITQKEDGSGDTGAAGAANEKAASASPGQGGGADLDRLALFEDVNAVIKDPTKVNLNAADVDALVGKAMKEIQAAQDYYLGRTPEQREKQYAWRDAMGKLTGAAEAALARKNGGGASDADGGNFYNGPVRGGSKFEARESALGRKGGMMGGTPLQTNVIRKSNPFVNQDPAAALAKIKEALSKVQSGQATREELERTSAQAQQALAAQQEEDCEWYDLGCHLDHWFGGGDDHGPQASPPPPVTDYANADFASCVTSGDGTCVQTADGVAVGSPSLNQAGNNGMCYETRLTGCQYTLVPTCDMSRGRTCKPGEVTKKVVSGSCRTERVQVPCDYDHHHEGGH